MTEEKQQTASDVNADIRDVLIDRYQSSLPLTKLPPSTRMTPLVRCGERILAASELVAVLSGGHRQITLAGSHLSGKSFALQDIAAKQPIISPAPEAADLLISSSSGDASDGEKKPNAPAAGACPGACLYVDLAALSAALRGETIPLTREQLVRFSVDEGAPRRSAGGDPVAQRLAESPVIWLLDGLDDVLDGGPGPTHKEQATVVVLQQLLDQRPLLQDEDGSPLPPLVHPDDRFVIATRTTSSRPILIHRHVLGNDVVRATYLPRHDAVTARCEVVPWSRPTAARFLAAYFKAHPLHGVPMRATESASAEILQILGNVKLMTGQWLYNPQLATYLAATAASALRKDPETELPLGVDPVESAENIFTLGLLTLFDDPDTKNPIRSAMAGDHFLDLVANEAYHRHREAAHHLAESYIEAKQLGGRSRNMSGSMSVAEDDDQWGEESIGVLSFTPSKSARSSRSDSKVFGGDDDTSRSSLSARSPRSSNVSLSALQGMAALGFTVTTDPTAPFRSIAMRAFLCSRFLFRMIKTDSSTPCVAKCLPLLPASIHLDRTVASFFAQRMGWARCNKRRQWFMDHVATRFTAIYGADSRKHKEAVRKWTGSAKDPDRSLERSISGGVTSPPPPTDVAGSPIASVSSTPLKEAASEAITPPPPASPSSKLKRIFSFGSGRVNTAERTAAYGNQAGLLVRGLKKMDPNTALPAEQEAYSLVVEVVGALDRPRPTFEECQNAVLARGALDAEGQPIPPPPSLPRVASKSTFSDGEPRSGVKLSEEDFEEDGWNGSFSHATAKSPRGSAGHLANSPPTSPLRRPPGSPGSPNKRLSVAGANSPPPPQSSTPEKADPASPRVATSKDGILERIRKPFVAIVGPPRCFTGMLRPAVTLSGSLRVFCKVLHIRERSGWLSASDLPADEAADLAVSLVTGNKAFGELDDEGAAVLSLLLQRLGTAGGAALQKRPEWCAATGDAVSLREVVEEAWVAADASPELDATRSWQTTVEWCLSSRHQGIVDVLKENIIPKACPALHVFTLSRAVELCGSEDPLTLWLLECALSRRSVDDTQLGGSYSSSPSRSRRVVSPPLDEQDEMLPLLLADMKCVRLLLTRSCPDVSGPDVALLRKRLTGTRRLALLGLPPEEFCGSPPNPAPLIRLLARFTSLQSLRLEAVQFDLRLFPSHAMLLAEAIESSSDSLDIVGLTINGDLKELVHALSSEVHSVLQLELNRCKYTVGELRDDVTPLSSAMVFSEEPIIPTLDSEEETSAVADSAAAEIDTHLTPARQVVGRQAEDC